MRRHVGLSLIFVMLLAGSLVKTASADPPITPVRLGFQAGDDWEPSIAADRFGERSMTEAQAKPGHPDWGQNRRVQAVVVSNKNEFAR